MMFRQQDRFSFKTGVFHEAIETPVVAVPGHEPKIARKTVIADVTAALDTSRIMRRHPALRRSCGIRYGRVAMIQISASTARRLT